MSNFLGNKKHQNYKAIVKNLLDKYKELGCNMSLKVHFLDSHLDVFPKNLGAVSEEQGERFHQDMKELERRYQGHWDVSMMADYCWMIDRTNSEKAYKRIATRRGFKAKKRKIEQEGAEAAERGNQSKLCSLCELL